MSKIQKILKLPEDEFYKKHLEIINSVMDNKLTPKELEVLAAFISLKGDIAEQDRFGTSSRKIIKERLSLEDGGLGNYIKALKTKNFIFEVNGKLVLSPIILIPSNPQFYLIRLEHDDN